MFGALRILVTIGYDISALRDGGGRVVVGRDKTAR